MSRIVIRHNSNIPLISEAYNKMAEFDKPFGIGLLAALHLEATNKIVLFYSTDGKNFDYLDTGQPQLTGAGNQVPTDAAFSTQLNRYVASSGTTGTSLGFVIYSDDLKNWFTSSTAYSYGTRMTSIDYSPSLNRFVAVGYDKPQYSTNGLSWTKTTSVVNTQWTAVKWFEPLGKFYTFLTSTLATSTDGITWTQGTSSLLQDIAYSTLSNRLVGVYGSFSRFSFSDDGGSTWTYITQSSASFSNVDFRGVQYSEELDLFVAVGLKSVNIDGFANNIFAVSQNGLTWSAITGPYDGWTNITWSDEFREFAMFPGNGNWSGSSQFARTSDGFSWFTSSQYGGTSSGSTITTLSIPNLLI